MAIRTKTVEYVFPSFTGTIATGLNLTSSTSQIYEFPAITCSFPETGSRTFKSVMAEFTWNDWFGAATNLSGVIFGISSGTAAASYVTSSYAVANGFTIMTNTGDPENFSWLVDFTPQVTDAKFGLGTLGALSGVYQLNARFATSVSSSVTNLAAKMYFTYEYEESTATKLVKTVRIPIQSHHTTLTTLMSEVGVFTGTIPAPTFQIPKLSTFLPETSGRQIYQAWLELYSNQASTATTNFSGVYQIDNSSSFQVRRAFFNQALNGDSLVKDIMLYDTGSYVEHLSHSFNAASSVTARHQCIGGFLGVTYGYDNDINTNPTRLNSIILGTDSYNKNYYMNGSSSADMDWRYIKFQIPENNPVLRQSAFVHHIMSPGGATFGAREAKQTLSRSYTLGNFTTAGGSVIHHRFDHSGTVALVKGENVLTSTFQSNGTTTIGPWAHWAIVNYTSDVSSLNEGAHNHTTAWCLASSSVAPGPNFAQTAGATIRSASIDDSNYFLNSVIYDFCLRNSNTIDFNLQMSLTGNENFINGGWVSVIPLQFNWSDLELQPIRFWNDAKDLFNPYPQFTGTYAARSDIELPKRYRFWVGVTGPWWLRKYVTYHSLTSSVNGTITGSAGGNIDIRLIRLSDFSVVNNTSRTGNGAFSMSWYNSDSNNYIVMARESANCKGISAAGTPGTSTFDIVLSSSTAAGSGSTTIVASNYAFLG